MFDFFFSLIYIVFNVSSFNVTCKEKSIYIFLIAILEMGEL